MGGWRDGEMGRRGDPSLPAAACRLPPASCRLLCRSRRGEQDLLVQVRRRIARDADVIYAGDIDSRGFQAIADRFGRKARAVLDSIEPLFFNGCDQLSVLDDRRRRITVVCVYA